MSFGSFSLRRSWTKLQDYARVYATVALDAGSHTWIGLGVRLLRWSRAASSLPFRVFAHCILELFDWREAQPRAFRALIRGLLVERAGYGARTNRVYRRGRARLLREAFMVERRGG
jgi:hypothetical protein